MLSADIGERLPLGPVGLLCAMRRPALTVECTMSVGRVSRVDAKGNVFISRRLAGVFLAIRGVPPSSPDGVVNVLPVTACHPAEPIGVGLDSH